mmetsp:Transcript_13092/g.24607  ORF Transcript_13092/g.24607 Transcript_13092/m.24607 type:complete len:149 (+) Transcript_13092:93-539(+)
MSDLITKTVKTISAVHHAARKHTNSFMATLSNPESPKTAVIVLIFSTVAGMGCMYITERRREKYYEGATLNDNTSSETEISQNESLVRAMVENAKSSSPRENLENMAMAQKNFMLVPFVKSNADEERERNIINKIIKRSEEIRGIDKT